MRSVSGALLAATASAVAGWRPPHEAERAGDTAAKPLTPDQHRAADLLARGWTTQQAAHEVRVSKRTVIRWHGLREFEAAEQRTRAVVIDSEPTAKSVEVESPSGETVAVERKLFVVSSR